MSCYCSAPAHRPSSHPPLASTMRAVTLALSVYLALSGASAAKLGQPRGPHRDLEESPSASGSSLDSGEEEQATDKPLGDDSSLELAGIGPFSAGFDPTAHAVPAAPAPLTCASSFINCVNGQVGGSSPTCSAACAGTSSLVSYHEALSE